MPPRPFRDEDHCNQAMLRWLRSQVNRDLTYWRRGDHQLPLERRAEMIADCKARLSWLDTVDHWQSRDWNDQPSIKAQMESDRRFLLAHVRHVFSGFRGRDGWRVEWDYRLR
jgi:hypothetical protein